jgi:predicted nucleotidyltransferase
MSETIDWQQTAQVWQESPQVIAAWAFGSARDGTARPGSDVDIAVLLESPPSLEERIELLAKLETALQFAEIDLVVLNDAGPMLRFEAISGRPLFCRDPSRRATFVSLTAREYADEMALWQRGLREWHILHSQDVIEA